MTQAASCVWFSGSGCHFLSCNPIFLHFLVWCAQLISIGLGLFFLALCMHTSHFCHFIYFLMNTSICCVLIVSYHFPLVFNMLSLTVLGWCIVLILGLFIHLFGTQNHGECCMTSVASVTPTFCPPIIAGHTNNTPDHCLATPTSDTIHHPCSECSYFECSTYKLSNSHPGIIWGMWIT